MVDVTEIGAVSPGLRARAHDLRNLFGAIASARHLIDDRSDAHDRAELLDAIEDAAIRGSALTTALLAPDSELRGRVARVDPVRRLAQLEPLIRSIAGARIATTITARCGATELRVDPDGFDNALLELVTNARNAIVGQGTIHVRLRARRRKLRLLVADSGSGMSGRQIANLVAGGLAPGSARGNGFQSVRRFVEAAHGTIRVRSRIGRGTIVAIELPILMRLAAPRGRA